MNCVTVYTQVKSELSKCIIFDEFKEQTGRMCE